MCSLPYSYRTRGSYPTRRPDKPDARAPRRAVYARVSRTPDPNRTLQRTQRIPFRTSTLRSGFIAQRSSAFSRAGALARTRPGCQFIYKPITVAAEGIWNGVSMSYHRTFLNRCVEQNSNRCVFAF
ncbi:SSI family serine proteinase inhibitor [Nocardia sp. NPDC005998]|uniref:SSI family serine proteinase inhibitor n=1 Tax=Nocardia sp. NPDC005998 TaxID=3156894 RepID=UPI0033A6E9A7